MALEENYTHVFHLLYFGPTQSGKTTTIKALYEQTPVENRSEWSHWEEDSMSSFSSTNFPLEEVRLQFYCIDKPLDQVPNLNLILSEIDGVVFVMDSQKMRLEDNRQAMDTLKGALAECSTPSHQICWLFQYNFRDKENVLSVEELEKELNGDGHPYVESVATQERGLRDALEKIAREMKDTAQTTEANIEEDVLGQASSSDIQVKFDPGEKPLLSREDALEKLQQDGVLEEVAVEFLDLSNQSFSQPLRIQNVVIGELNCRGATFEQTLEIRNATFHQGIRFSSTEHVTKVQEDLEMVHVLSWGEIDLSALVVRGTTRLIDVEIKRSSLTLHRAVLHGDLILTDSSLYHGDFRSLSVEGQARFDPVYFQSSANFRRARFQSEAIFTGAIFEGAARLREVYFGGLTDFSGTDFQDEAVFADAQFVVSTEFLKTCFGGPVNFQRVDFRDFTKFSRVMFQAESIWDGMRCALPIVFEECEFFDTATFQKVIFSRAEFQYVQFRGEANFSAAVFRGPANYHETVFHGDVYFRHAHFLQRADLKGSDILQGISLMGVEASTLSIYRGQIHDKLISVMEEDWEEAAWEYRLLQKVFVDAHSFDEGDWAYYRHRIAQRRSLGTGSLQRGFDWLILDVGCGYGTRPFNILFNSLAIILLFAMVFALVLPHHFFHPAQPDATINLAGGLALSVSTFTTTGFSGWHPHAGWLPQLLLSLEALVGMFAIVLFAATFIRKTTH